MRFDLAVVNTLSLITCAVSSDGPKRGRAMREVHPIPRGVVGIVDGKIAWIGAEKEFRKHRASETIDAQGGLVLPGFIDCHTHAVFAGTRVEEWEARLSGVPYLEALKKGAGILETVRATRLESAAKLSEVASEYLLKMLRHGTTTVEVKSGYGLSLAAELKILRIIRRLGEKLPIQVVPTFLGAHAVPPEYKGKPDNYVEAVTAMLPKVRGLAKFCDVFCEKEAFSAAQAERIFQEARRLGMVAKIHAGEFTDLGGVGAALRHGAVSADHLDVISAEDIKKMAGGNTVGVLLPGVSHFLGLERWAPARELIDAGAPVALATDFNPGSSPCLSLQEIIGLAVLKMKMTAEEALTGVTLNAAAAIGLSKTIGSIEVGKQADLVCLDLGDLREIPYFFGANHVRWVVEKGMKASFAVDKRRRYRID